jgi:hypothetical protein
MFQTFDSWWRNSRWKKQQDDAQLLEAYRETFATDFGKIVLNHLLGSIYCSTYEGNDPTLALVHNARRGVIEEILQNIDAAEHPGQGDIKVDETPYDVRSDGLSEVKNG